MSGGALSVCSVRAVGASRSRAGHRLQAPIVLKPTGDTLSLCVGIMSTCIRTSPIGARKYSPMAVLPPLELARACMNTSASAVSGAVLFPLPVPMEEGVALPGPPARMALANNVSCPNALPSPAASLSRSSWQRRSAR